MKKKLLEMFSVTEAPQGNTGPAPMTRDPSVPDSFHQKTSAAPQKKAGDKPLPQHGSKMAKRPGLSISGDPETMEALLTALQAVRTKDRDIMDWVDDCTSALRIPVKQEAFNAQLPRFEATPSLDSFNDDLGGSDEDY